MGPRPFVPFHLQSHTPSPVTHVESPVTVSINSSSFHQPSRDGVVKATRIIVQPPFNDEANHTNRSMTGSAHSSTGMFNVKRTPRGRYMTISSSEPVRLETSLITPTSPNTAAGDLITNRVSPHWYYTKWGLTQTDGPRVNGLACHSTGLDLLVFLYMLSRLHVQTMLELLSIYNYTFMNSYIVYDFAWRYVIFLMENISWYMYLPYIKIMHSNAVAIKKSSIMQLVFHMIYILFTILWNPYNFALIFSSFLVCDYRWTWFQTLSRVPRRRPTSWMKRP